MADINEVYVCKNCGSTSLRIKTANNYIHPCIKCNSKDLCQINISAKKYLSMKKKGEWDGYLISLFPDESKIWSNNIKIAKEKYKSTHANISQPLPNNRPMPKCPICGSTNLSKITTAHKVGKVMMLGVFGMGDNGKTWKCDNCGSRF